VTDQTIEVHVDLHGTSVLVGQLHTRSSRGREGASLVYADEWLRHTERFALEPGLTLGPAPHHTQAGRALFGALGDSAPDRWGRNLINRAERRRAKAEKRAPRTLREIDYLLGVTDAVRPGALRFKQSPDGPFLADSGQDAVPPLVALPRLLDASARVENEKETADDMRLLLAPGSSLGGARPKASVRDGGALHIAKFPSEKDPYDLIGWETVELTLAEKAGVAVTKWRLEKIAGRRVLLVQRFDREGTERVPFLSMMSLLGATDGATHSYPEIAEALRQHGAAVAKDLPQLFRRMVFNVLASNFDDHLRNHGVLYAGRRGWRLSPAYDLNPVPIDLKPRILATIITIGHDPTASLDLALEVAGDFAVKPAAAKAIAREVGRATAGWRTTAAKLGLKKAEMERMATAFEHEDARKARVL
jgi:serine/threonine-protein kinase HipA